MPKRQFRLSAAQQSELLSAYLHCKDGPTRTRYQAVRLYGCGYALNDIIDITGCSRTSLMEWCQGYSKDGITALVDKRSGGNHRKLSAQQIAELRGCLHRYTPAQLFGLEAGRDWTIDTLKRAVEQLYGVIYRTHTSYHQLFRRCGFSYQRRAQVYKPYSASKAIETVGKN